METPDELGIEDTSLLTDAEWAEINKLSRAYKSGGEKALKKACLDLAEHPRQWVRVFGAFFPDKIREALKDAMARAGINEDDLIELDRKLQNPAVKQ
jgi:hypothetical protein